MIHMNHMIYKSVIFIKYYILYLIIPRLILILNIINCNVYEDSYAPLTTIHLIITPHIFIPYLNIYILYFILHIILYLVGILYRAPWALFISYR